LKEESSNSIEGMLMMVVVGSEERNFWDRLYDATYQITCKMCFFLLLFPSPLMTVLYNVWMNILNRPSTMLLKELQILWRNPRSQFAAITLSKLHNHIILSFDLLAYFYGYKRLIRSLSQYIRFVYIQWPVTSSQR
jgi:hypothetical protein